MNRAPLTQADVAVPSYVTIPPTQDELPCDDGVPMETERHRLQMELLIESLKPWLDDRGEGYVGGNMFVYFSMEQVRGKDFRGPDVFVVLGVPQRERKCWVVWEETKGPDVVIELLSESTADDDRGFKKDVYQNQLRVPEYYWFNPFEPDEWAGFVLHDGAYQPLFPDDEGRLLSPRLGLALTRWHGVYQGVETVWLRWALPKGELLPTGQEAAEQRAAMADRRVKQERRRAEQERQRAEQERQRAEQERQRAERLAVRLRELGVNPDDLL